MTNMIIDFLMLIHPLFGMLAILSTLWLLIEVINIDVSNKRRIQIASYNVALWMFLTWVFAGYWYVDYYAADKELLVKSNWAFAHRFFMESKEHIFFIPLILAFYLPIIVMKNNLLCNTTAKKLVIVVCSLILIISL